MSDWYLVYTKARQEDVAASGLEEQGYRVYLPKLKVKRRRPGGKIDVEEPLFPRYLFAAPTQQEQSISPMQYTSGVQKLVKFGHIYLSVSDDIVEAIRKREDPSTGFHRLAMPSLKPGDAVRMKTGPFAGIDGIFEAQSGQDRVIVLLEILGQQTRTEVSIGELES
jgi:transcriptional antiterminator RfaH